MLWLDCRDGRVRPSMIALTPGRHAERLAILGQLQHPASAWHAKLNSNGCTMTNAMLERAQYLLRQRHDGAPRPGLWTGPKWPWRPGRHVSIWIATYQAYGRTDSPVGIAAEQCKV